MPCSQSIVLVSTAANFADETRSKQEGGGGGDVSMFGTVTAFVHSFHFHKSRSSQRSSDS